MATPVQSPSNISDETGLIAFYNELSSLVDSIPKHNVFIIGGDMIAQMVKTWMTNSTYTTRQTEMGNIYYISHSKID